VVRQIREVDDVRDRPVIVEDRARDEGGTGLGVVLGVILAVVIAGALIWLVMAGRTPITNPTTPTNSNNPTININPPNIQVPDSIKINPPANAPVNPPANTAPANPAP